MKHSRSIPFFRFILLILLMNNAVDLFAQQITGPDVTFHFQPEGKVFGDPIPFFHDGVHHLFYLEQYTLPDGKLGGHSWAHLASSDLVTWKQLPWAIVPDEHEPFIATGSIVENKGVFYAFYCTAYGEEKDPSICVATSSDLIHWTKSPHNPLIRLSHDVPGDIYETKIVWRDPHVFWNPEEKMWWMAVAALERNNGDYVRSGAVAYATSIDLMDWHVQRKPMFLDRDCLAGECPDIFPFGNGWAMIYYPDMTRIRLSDSPQGPWRRPKNDAPSGLHFNAGKTEFDGNRFIWQAYLARLSHDYDKHKYGGVMALPRELYMDTTGNPAVRLVPEIVEACSKDITGGLGGKVFIPLLESPVISTSNTLILEPGAGENALALWKDAPENFFLATDIKMQEDGQLTLYFRSTQNVDDSYILRIDARNSEVSFQRWTGWNRMSPMNARSLEIPKDRSFKLYVMLDGDVFEAFIDDRIAIGTRIQLPKGSFAVSARDSKVEMKNLRLTHLK